MGNTSPLGTLKVANEKRILNELGGKILNEERMDKVLDARKGGHHSAHSAMLFTCECDDADCVESISMSTEEYKTVHRKTMHFIVIPSHVHLDLEEVITAFDNYTLVRKF